jgi:putative ABC transport system permease protein
LFVVAQIALAAVSLIAAGLITKSLVRLHNVEFAFEPRQLLVANLVMGNDQISGAERRRATLDLVMERAGALPGVSGVTPVMSAPFVGAGGGIDGRLAKPGQSVDEAAGNPILNLEAVATNYFEMLGIPVLRGRSFADADREGTRPVIVVSATVAQHFWPNADPIGKTLRGGGKEYYVVGVVPDTRYRELRTARSTVYLPLKQAPFGGMLPSTLLIRTTGAPEAVISAMRRAVSDVHPAAVVTSATPLQTLLDVPRAEPRLNAIVLGLFAIVAVALAAIGLFAVIATLVRQRTREIGIRMALGASAGNVRRIVMLRGVSLAAAGTALGIAGALGTGRLLAALLFQVNSTDVPTLVSVSGLILIIALLACYLPARSSSRVDPVIALRNET